MAVGRLQERAAVLTLTPAETFDLIQTLRSAFRELECPETIPAILAELVKAHGEPIAETDSGEGGIAVAA